MATTTNSITTTCVICKRDDIPTEGKHLHLCIVRDGRTVISREWIGWFDGRPINYGADRASISAELDAYVYDLLRHTAAETADMLADVAAEQSSEAPLLVEPGQPMCDALGCHQWAAHCISGFANQDYNGNWCCYHYEGLAGSCDCSDDDYLDALAESAMGSYNGSYNGRTTIDPPTPDPGPPPWEPRTCAGVFPDVPCTNVAASSGWCARCETVMGRIEQAALRQWAATARAIRSSAQEAPSIFRPVVADALLDEVDAVIAAARCRCCGGAHHIQQCPELRALLFAPVVARVLEVAA